MEIFATFLPVFYMLHAKLSTFNPVISFVLYIVKEHFTQLFEYVFVHFT